MLYILFIGLAAGAVAGIIVRGRGYGFIVNLLVGVAGAYLGNWLIVKTGVHILHGIMGTFIIALIGAVLLLYVLTFFKKTLDK